MAKKKLTTQQPAENVGREPSQAICWLLITL